MPLDNTTYYFIKLHLNEKKSELGWVGEVFEEVGLDYFS